jgi:hypothetical protein
MKHDDLRVTRILFFGVWIKEMQFCIPKLNGFFISMQGHLFGVKRYGKSCRRNAFSIFIEFVNTFEM